MDDFKLIKPDTADILAIGDADLRLDTGMTAKEAIQRSMHWWETKGRKEMQTQAMRQAKPVGGADNGAGASFVSNNADDPRFLPSGILQALPWDQLGQREKINIVKTWHHFHIRNSDLIGADPEQRHKMQDRGLIQ